MTTQQHLIEKLQPLIAYISKLDGMSKVVLFGSFARHQQTITSDVDIAIIHRGHNPQSLRRHLSQGLYQYYQGEEDIQFTTLQEAVYETNTHPLNVSHSIAKEGVILWQK